MRYGLFTFGKSLLIVAFVATIIELSARMMAPNIGGLPSSAEIWSVFSPANYQAFIANHADDFWKKLLDVPPIMTFGVPGLFLIIVFRDKNSGTDPELEASLFLFDELAKRVKEEDFNDEIFEENFEDEELHKTSTTALDTDGPKRDFLLDQNR